MGVFEPRASFKSFNEPDRSECVFVCDGSSFVPALPSLKLLTSVAEKQRHRYDKLFDPDLLNWVDESFVCWRLAEGPKDSNGLYMYVAPSWRDLRDEAYAFTINEYWECSKFKTMNTLLWRPVLIPTDQYGNRDEKIDFENGTKVEGCSLYVDGEEFTDAKSMDVSGKTVVIGDTGEHPLPWFWWDGLMVALFTVCCMDCRTLVKNHLAGPICREDYTPRRRCSRWCW